MERSDQLKELLVSILKSLVSNPDAVVVEKKVDEMGLLFTVRVGEGEWGKVIGKGGVIASSIRTIFRAAGYISDIRVAVKIEPPDFNSTPRERES